MNSPRLIGFRVVPPGLPFLRMFRKQAWICFACAEASLKLVFGHRGMPLVRGDDGVNRYAGGSSTKVTLVPQDQAAFETNLGAACIIYRFTRVPCLPTAIEVETCSNCGSRLQ